MNTTATDTTETQTPGYKWQCFDGHAWTWESDCYLTVEDAYYRDRSFDPNWKLFHVGPDGVRLIETNAYPQGAAR